MSTIVLTLGCLNIGGAELRLLQLLREIADRKIPVRVFVFVVSGMPGVLDDEYRKTSATIVYGKEGPAGLILLWQLCRRIKPDLLHVNAETAAGFYNVAGMSAGVRKRIAHFRSCDISTGLRWLDYRKWIYESLTSILSTHIVGVSEASRSNRFVSAAKWQVIYNGVRSPTPLSGQAERPISRNAHVFNILLLGRLDTVKNVPRALNILRALIKLRPAHRIALHLVGPDGNARTQIDQLCQQENLHHVVCYHGPTHDARPFLEAANVLLCTSIREGLPGAVIEALAYGTPVVASSVGGIPEIARQTRGLKVLPLSSADRDWAQAIWDASATPRNLIQESFTQSPFTFEKYFGQMLDLWQLSPVEQRGNNQ